MPENASYPLKWITPAIAVCYAPKSENDLDEIHRQGITAIINMCAECYDLADIEERAGFQVYRLLVADMEVPDINDLEKAMAWFDDHLKSGQKVLVHCRFGLGRTGTFLLAFFVRNGDTLESAMARLKSTPTRPQSRRQWAFIENYLEKKRAPIEETIPKMEDNHVKAFFKRQLDRLKWFE